MSKLLFGRIIKVTIESDTYKGSFDYEDLEIRFEVPFDDDSKPNQSFVEIFNLTPTTINRIKKNSVITIQAGYRGDFGVIAMGRVTRTKTRREGVDKITTVHMKEGDDLSHLKADGNKKITFKSGTNANTIINRLAGMLKIKIQSIDLPKNKVYKKGLTVSGSVENKLNEVVKDCGAAMYYRRGRLVIRSIKTGDDERFKLEEATGLIETPEQIEDEDVTGYAVKCLLQHRITTASIIEIQSKTAKGRYRAKRGKHYFDGSDFFTEVDVI